MQQEELNALEAMLRSAQVLIPGNYAGNNPYVLIDYLAASTLNGDKFHALFDRNLISPLVALASGRPIPEERNAAENGRLAAACVAFCILANILIEPNIALYEYASSGGNLAAHADYKYFRIADNADPVAFLDIAFGRSNHLPEDLLSQVAAEPGVGDSPSPEAVFDRSLRLWKPNYLCVLKTLSLRRSGLSPIQAALELMRWQAHEAFCNAPASMYCIAAISHAPPKGQMLKGINSDNLLTVRSGAKNATWDICMLKEFYQNCRTPEGPKWSLWSTDIALGNVARSLFISEGAEEEIALRDFYCNHWGRSDGKLLWHRYKELTLAAGIGTTERSTAVNAAFASIDVSISALEIELGLSTV